ncbi:molybdate transport system substrate-binding protein [Streptosporangium becharense]|uniref:Molybdate transport system substrate-binding protein n=1 Tax=Streptosporangium becharense TaxID=1816182 RepID=A0A7W9MI88_9ACTN|nr:molybdate transport system substrate-binding protein [Streptosporangium becharense]MBB5821725.1 molybdate transport system substrate-binding protein [Streptosporangium becharense]
MRLISRSITAARESRRVVRGLFPTVALAALLAVTGCGAGAGAEGGRPAGAGGGAARTVTVFAAASLTESFTRLGADFEAANPGVDVRFNFGSSATLAQQIVQGAPADVFAAASPATMKTVADASLAANPVVFARNRLEIALPAGNPAKIDDLADLAGPGVKVALCAPQVPCGAAAAKALAAAGLKIVPVTLEQDVKATLTKVTLGEVDAALVYRTDVLAAVGKVQGLPFPEAAQAVNDYPIAALAKAPSGDLAGRFVALVTSPQGRVVLTGAGFETP